MITDALREILGDDKCIQLLNERLSREGEVIRAMQYRVRKFHGPIGNFFWRKPWKAPYGPGLSRDYKLAANLGNLRAWLRLAHDCSDPSIGCSCTGSYRFPTPNGPKGE